MKEGDEARTGMGIAGAAMILIAGEETVEGILEIKVVSGKSGVRCREG